MNLSYEWAIQTKRPGDTKDYRILGQTQGEISDKEFDRVFRSLSVGELPGASDLYNPPPPWVAFGFFAGPHTHYLACIRQDWTEKQDASNRQISYASCLCIPFEQIAQSQSSLAQIAHLHDALNLPLALKQIADSPTDQAINLDRPTLTFEKAPVLETVAAQIDTTGFEYFASIAATFLFGPVVLVGGKPTWEESLNNLEAVLSLLPFGARANASVSTWTRTASINSLRLSFSSSGSREKEYIQWVSQASAQKPAPSQKMNLDYFNLLVEAHKRHSTLKIIQHLSGSTGLLSFETPELFVTTLRFLDRPYLILESLRSAPNTPNANLQAEIRDLLESDQARLLNPADRQKMLDYLLAVGSDPKNPAVLAKNWNSALWDGLAARTVHDFLSEDMAGLSYCLDVARINDKLEDFFAVLLKSENLVTKHNRAVVIQLMRKALRSVTDPARDPLFVLLMMTPFPAEFSLEWLQWVTEDDQADDKDSSIIFRLCHSPEFAQRSLRITLGLQNEVLDVEALNEITRTEPRNSVLLLSWAIKIKSLNNVALAFSQWALKNSFRPSPQEFQNAWEAMIKRIDGNMPNAEPIPCANFDVVWLNFSGNRQPLWLGRALQAETNVFNLYSTIFCKAVETPGINQLNIGRNLDTFLSQYLQPQHPLSPLEFHHLDLFIDDANQTLNDERLFMTQQKIKLRQYLDTPRSIKDIIACCVSILNDKRINAPTELIISQMIEANFIFPPGGVKDLLQQIEAQSPEHSAEFENLLVSAILAGKFGPILAGNFRQRWSEKIIFEIDVLTRHIAMLDPKDPNLPRISAELEAKLGKYLPKKKGIW